MREDKALSHSSNPLAWFGGFGVIAILLYVMEVGKDILQPLFIAAFLVMILHGLKNFIKRLHIGDLYVPTPIAMVIAIFISLGGMFLMVEIFIGNVSRLTGNVSTYQENFDNLVKMVMGLTGMTEYPSLADLLNQISINTVLTEILGGFRSITGDIFKILLFMAFLLLEEASIRRKLKRMTDHGEDMRPWQESLKHISKMMENYIGAKAIISFATALVSFILMRFMGLDYPGFWALLIFVMNFIPYIGSLVAVLFPIFLSLLQFSDPFSSLYLAIGLILTQIAFGNIIEPRLMGHSLNISPLVLLLSLALFGALWGVVGMFLAVPLAVVALVGLAQSPFTRSIAIMISANGDIEHLYNEDRKQENS